MTATAACRVCGATLEQPAFHAAAPALTSITTSLDSATQVYVCPVCSHAQCPGPAER